MINNKQRPLVISGPSGSGKSTLLARLFQDYPSTFKFSVSHTTRSIRPTETNGSSYHFVPKATFTDLIAQNKFLEYTEFAGNMYGTSIQAVESVLTNPNEICVLDIEMNGIKAIKSLIESNKITWRPVFVFVRAPSIDVLRQRLTSRGTDPPDAIENRLKVVERELAYAQQDGVFDYVIVNTDVDIAYQRLKQYVQHLYSL